MTLTPADIDEVMRQAYLGVERTQGMILPEEVKEVHRLALLGSAMERKLGHTVDVRQVERVQLPTTGSRPASRKPAPQSFSFAGHDDWIATKTTNLSPAPIARLDDGATWSDVRACVKDLIVHDEVPQHDFDRVLMGVRRVLQGNRETVYGMRFSYITRQ